MAGGKNCYVVSTATTDTANMFAYPAPTITSAGELSLIRINKLPYWRALE